MTRASISSLVATAQGLSLLWIHICLLFWLTLSWIATLLWISHGAFKLRAAKIENTARRIYSDEFTDTEYHPHPHPQYGFTDVESLDNQHPNQGLRLRTVMVSNVPPQLRDEKVLKEYFEYYMSRKLSKPSMGLTSSTQPGFLNKMVAFMFNHAKRIPARLPTFPVTQNEGDEAAAEPKDGTNPVPSSNFDNVPVVDRVVVARKMTELASLLERREDILRLLETAHIKLAKKTLWAVQRAIEREHAGKQLTRFTTKQRRKTVHVDAERGDAAQEGTLNDEERMRELIQVLGPYVKEFGLHKHSIHLKKSFPKPGRHLFHKLRAESSSSDLETPPVDTVQPAQAYPPASSTDDRRRQEGTIWEALLSLPRSHLDAYQPLINLSHLFRGKSVPAIDYYTAKLGLLTSLITENRAKATRDFDPVSTAFVTFADPADARRACRYLAVHPNNPLNCLVTMAPAYQDLDWIRVMKSSYNAEVCLAYVWPNRSS